MGIDRDRMQVLRRERIIWTRWHWHIRLVALGAFISSVLVLEVDSGPVRLAARAVITVMVVVVGGAHAVDIVRDVQAYEWSRWGRFAWMRYIALTAGLLIEISVMYALLVFVYPALRPTPMTSVALATLGALAVLALAGLAVVVLIVLLVLFCLPVVIVRARLRERRRRHYRYPAY